MNINKLKNEEDQFSKKIPNDVISFCKEKAEEVLNEITSSDSMSKKVYKSDKKFQSDIS